MVFSRIKDFIAFVLCFLSINAYSDDINIESPWVLSQPAVSANGAIYLVLVNSGMEPDVLFGGETEAAEKVELHEYDHVHGAMKMKRLESIVIPAHDSVIFEPGGRHIMLVNLRVHLNEGLEFPLVLEFDKAGKIAISIKVVSSPPGVQ